MKKFISFFLIISLLTTYIPIVSAEDLGGAMALTGFQPASDNIIDINQNSELEKNQTENDFQQFDGSYETNLFTGAATYKYPIKLPQYRKNLVPEIALVYSSQNAKQDSIVGYGWDLNWASIKRKQEAGIETLYNKNLFTAEIFGKTIDLVPYNLSDGKHGEYKAQYENSPFWKYFYNNNESWTIINQDGTKYQFGLQSSAKEYDPDNNAKIYEWFIEEIIDTNTSVIQFSYTKNNNKIYPSAITYGPIIVSFEYETRSDTFIQYNTGFAITTNLRLNKITVKVADEISKQQNMIWDLDYISGDNVKRSLLQKITQSGTNLDQETINLEPVIFEYTEREEAGFKFNQYKFPNSFTKNDRDLGVRMFDINSDGFDDFVRAYYEKDIYTSPTVPISEIYLNNKDLTWIKNDNWILQEGFVYNTDISSYPVTATNMNLIDIDNDSLIDVAEGNPFRNTGMSVYFNTGNQLKDKPGWATIEGKSTSNNGVDTGLRFVDINSDGYPDIIKSYLKTACGNGTQDTWVKENYFNNPEIKNFETSTLYQSPEMFVWNWCGDTAFDKGVRFVDVNSDGLIDMIGSLLDFRDITNLSDEQWYSNFVYFNDGKGGFIKSSWRVPVAIVYTQTGVAIPNEFKTYTNLDEITKPNPNEGGLDAGVRLMDLNGDGLVDILKSDGLWKDLESDLNSYMGISIDYEDSAVYLNNGVSGWDKVSDIYGYPLFTDTWAHDAKHRLTDVNGDSLTDIAYSFEEENSRGIYLNQSKPSDLLTKITSAFGGSTEISYKNSSIDNNMPFNHQVVDKIKIDNGLDDIYLTNYQYENGKYLKYSTYKTEFAGFEKVIVNYENSSEIFKFDQGDNNYGQKGKLKYKKILDSEKNILKQEDYVWETKDLGSNAFFTYLKQKIDLSFDGQETHKDQAIEYKYDLNTGNLIEEKNLGEVIASPAGQEYNSSYSESTNLIAYYKFNEGQGTVTYDSTERGHSMYFNGLSGWNTGYEGYGGDVDWSYEFIETYDNNDDFDLSDTYTISFWIKLDNPQYNNYPVLIAKYDLYTGKNSDESYRLMLHGDKLEWWIMKNDLDLDILSASGSVPFGQWVHIAVISDGEYVNLYVNNKIDANYMPALDPNNSKTAVVIGAQKGDKGGISTTNFLQAVIDELRFYKDRAYEWPKDLMDTDLTDHNILQTFETENTITDYLPGDEIKKTYEYNIDQSNWIITIDKETLYNANETKTASTDYSYDSKGNLISNSQWLNTENRFLTTNFTLNSYGLVTAETNPKGYVTNITYDSYNLYPTQITNPLNQKIYYKYDYLNGKILSETNVNNYTTEYTYDGFGRLIKEYYPNPETGEKTLVLNTTFYDNIFPNFSKTNKIVNGISVESRLYADGFGKLIQKWNSAENSGFNIIDFWYDEFNNLLKRTLPYTDYISSFNSRNNDFATINYSYDGLNRLLSEIWPIGNVTHSYSHWKETVIDANSHKKEYFYDAYHRPIQINEVNGANIYQTKYNFDSLGNLTKIIDAKENIKNFTYDSLSRKLNQEDLHTSSSTNFGKWLYTYDDNNNLITQIDPKNQTIFWIYDELNRIKSEDWNKDGNIDIEFKYDNAENGIGLISEIIKNDLTTKYKYDALGNIKEEDKKIDNVNYITKSNYDILKRIKEIIYLNNTLKISYEYNSAGEINTIIKDNLTAIVTNIDYSAIKQISYLEYANGTQTTNTYDPNQNYRLINKISTGIYYDIDDDNDGATNAIDHCPNTPVGINVNGVGCPMTEEDSDGDQISNENDNCPNSYNSGQEDSDRDGIGDPCDSNIDGDGFNESYIDENGVYHSLDCNDTNSAITVADDKTCDGDSDGAVDITAGGTDCNDNNTAEWRIGNFYLDSDVDSYGSGDLVSVCYGNTISTNYVTNNTDNCPNNYNPDQLDSNNNGVGDVCEIVKKKERKKFQEKLPKQNQEKNKNSKKTSWINFFIPFIHASTNTSDIQNLTYVYDQVGNIIEIQDNSVTPTAKNMIYDYDDLDRLISAQSQGLADGDYTRTYTYDEIGNMTYKSDLGTMSYLSTGDPTPNAITNLPQATFTYDKNGNLTNDGQKSYNWNIKNQLINSGDINFSYDQYGNKIKSENTKTGEKIIYVNKYFEMRNGLPIYYILLNNLRIASIENENISYYHHDHLGGTNLITDQNGYVTQVLDYFPYGTQLINEKLGNTESKYSFTGKELDEDLDLYYFEARYYNHKIGRFMSQDPYHFMLDFRIEDIEKLEESQKIEKIKAQQQIMNFLKDPQKWNSYTYVENNPIKYIDPLGLWNGGDIEEMIDIAIEIGIDLGATMSAIGGAYGFIKWGNTGEKLLILGILTNNQKIIEIGKEMEKNADEIIPKLLDLAEAGLKDLKGEDYNNVKNWINDIQHDYEIDD